MTEQPEPNPEPRVEPSLRPPRMIEEPTSAKGSAQACLMFGLLAVGVGVFVAAAANPHTEIDTFTGSAVDKGSVGGYVAGLCAIGVGTTLVWIAVIAYAVSLGIRMTREP